MSTRTRLARRLVPVAMLLAWLAIGGALGPYAGRLGEVATNDQAAFLPRNAESTKVIDARRAFDEDETLPAIVVWTGDDDGDGDGNGSHDGRRLTADQREAADRALASL
ncbi:hypothetical protein ABZ366_26875, partial [Streptomyces sp. NPDC005904]